MTIGNDRKPFTCVGALMRKRETWPPALPQAPSVPRFCPPSFWQPRTWERRALRTR